MARLAQELYSVGARVAASGAAWWMKRKGRWSDESIAQRFGKNLPTASSQKPIWIHAASMGEVRVGSGLAHALSSKGTPIVASAMTETGFNLAGAIFPTGSTVIRAPFDLRKSVNAVVTHFNPGALVLIETELWPNMLTVAAQSNLPVFVVNGRISDKAFPSYRRTRWFWLNLLDGISRFYMRSSTDAERIVALGVDFARVEVSGSLKSANAPIVSERTKEVLSRLGPADAPIWIAASTRPGEEEKLLSTHKELLRQIPRLQLWLAPRHLDRFEEVASLLKKSGLAFTRWSELESGGKNREAQALLIDQMGILPELFSRSKIAFVGGSLMAFGGHNPVEPAIAGVPVIFGPHMETQRESADWLVQSGLAKVVKDQTEIVQAVLHAVSNVSEQSDREQRLGAIQAHSAKALELVADDIIRRIARGKSR